MSTQSITDPILLDSTGQQILSAIQDLTTAVQPTNVYVDIASTLTVSNWSSATPSVYTWTNSKVTGECAVEVFFSTGAESAPTPYIEYEKGVGSVIFYAPTGKPTVNLPVIIRIINAEADIASDIDADMVSTNAIPGTSNVQDALVSVNSSLGTVNSNINTLNDKITTENLGSLADQSALETALVTLGGSMSDMQFKNIRFNFSAVPSSGIFNGKAGYYIGAIKRAYNNVYAVDVQNSGTGSQKGEHITGTYNGTAWTWIDLNDKIDTKTDPITITNQYSTVLDAVNAYRNTKAFPFSIQKYNTSSYTDLPDGVNQACEWNVVCIGNAIRTTVILSTYTSASSNNTKLYIMSMYNGSVLYSWQELARKSEKLDNSNSNHTISLVGGTDFVGFDIRPTGASNFFRLNFFDNGKVSISRYASGAWQTEVTLRNAD